MGSHIGEHMNDAIKRGKVSIKGLEGKRRDNAAIGSDTQNAVIKILLKEGDVEKAERHVHSVIEDLLMDRVDMSQLVISKGLSKTEEQYAKGGTKQQHVELQKRMRKRSKYTGEAVPETGDRVPYIMKAGVNKKNGSKGADKACDLAEDPLFAQKNGVPINTEYYINKQIWPAVSALALVMLSNVEQVIRVFTGVHEPEKCVMIESNMSQASRESLKAHQRLFGHTLPHMLKKKVRKPRAYGIAAFVKPVPQCLGCGVSLKRGEIGQACCANCDADKIEQERMDALATKKRERDEAWDICRACQGGGYAEVTCSNFGCENFFHRNQTIIDMEDMEKDCSRFKKSKK